VVTVTATYAADPTQSGSPSVILNHRAATR
jgi:hypothetical protein